MGKKISAEEFDRIFDEGGDIMPYLDMDSAVVTDPKATKRVVVDFPAWMVNDLDKEAERLAVPRQSVIKMLIDQGLRRSEGHSKKAVTV